MLSFNINASAWEKVSVPDYVEKKKKSPWNFYDDFEDGKLRFEYIKNSKSISNSPERKPYKFKKDPNGNTYLEITVKDEWNKCCLGNFYSERAEIRTSKRNARNKIIWYKPNHQPSGVKDRFTNTWEYIYFFNKLN